jgi:hypothetical protein
MISKFLFCEGKNDLLVISCVAKHCGVEVAVEPFLGKDKLRAFLRDVRVRPEFAQQQVSAIAIVRDADSDPGAAFSSVRDALISNGFTAPAQNGGITDGVPRCGIFVYPPDKPGMIEDLCLDSIAHKPEFGCVEEYFKCIAARSNPSRSQASSKAKMRVWMSSQTDYEMHVGKAAEAGYFPWESDIFAPLREFFAADLGSRCSVARCVYSAINRACARECCCGLALA